MTDMAIRRPRTSPPASLVMLSPVLAWQELKRDYPQLYRHELAHAEEGRRAGGDGWVHATR